MQQANNKFAKCKKIILYFRLIIVLSRVGVACDGRSRRSGVCGRGHHQEADTERNHRVLRQVEGMEP